MQKASNSWRKQVRNQYLSGINEVLDYIEKNIARSFTLDELASQAGFSKYHFHRIFYTYAGETLFQFIQRLRLEKSATLLLNEPGKPVTDIALECGFANSSSFAKSFKKHFGISATDWRNHKYCNYSNLGQLKSNSGEELPASLVYIEYINNTQLWRCVMENQTRTVEVTELPETTLAYVRYVGPYKGDGQLFERLYRQLFQWAGPRNLLNFPTTKSIIVYHDNPEVTEDEKLRVSVCITVPSGTAVEGEVGKMIIPAGRYALARFELGEKDYQAAWDWVFGAWLPESGYLPDDRPSFEMYHNDPNTHPEDKAVVDICIPVKPV